MNGLWEGTRSLSPVLAAAVFLLASVPDAWVVGFPIVLAMIQAVVLVIQGILIRRTGQIDTLEQRVLTVTERRIDERFRDLEKDMAQIDADLIRGRDHFKQSDELRHALEVKVLEELSALKDRVATKDDLTRMRQELQSGRGH